MPLRITAAPREGIKRLTPNTNENPREGMEPLVARKDDEKTSLQHWSGSGNARQNAAARGDRTLQTMAKVPRESAVDQGSRPRRSQTKPDSSKPPPATNESDTGQKASIFIQNELFGSVTQKGCFETPAPRCISVSTEEGETDIFGIAFQHI